MKVKITYGFRTGIPLNILIMFGKEPNLKLYHLRNNFQNGYRSVSETSFGGTLHWQGLATFATFIHTETLVSEDVGGGGGGGGAGTNKV